MKPLFYSNYIQNKRDQWIHAKPFNSLVDSSISTDKMNTTGLHYYCLAVQSKISAWTSDGFLLKRLKIQSFCKPAILRYAHVFRVLKLKNLILEYKKIKLRLHTVCIPSHSNHGKIYNPIKDTNFRVLKSFENQIRIRN
ncbi:MAG: hypothetical protein IPL31_01640 [Saprospiraceae bacterium]|nr:hypothetical protein [Saprospiraceae bacterium]